MSSLVPFDFRCVGQLTGISLRCAPLHLCLPPGWPPTSADVAERHHKCVERAMASGLTAGGYSTPLLPGGVDPGAVHTFEQLRSGSTCTSSTATPLPPPGVEGTLMLAAQASSLNHSPVVTTPAAASASTATPSKPRVRYSAPRVISLHNPALCMEVFFKLQPIDGAVGGDDASDVARMKGKGKPADWTGGCAAITTASARALKAPAYTSEVARGSSHPNWSSIPTSALRPYSHHTHIELSVFYTGAFISAACALAAEPRAPDPPPAVAESAGACPSRAVHIEDEELASRDAVSRTPWDVCVHRFQIDVRHAFYMGATVEEADGTLRRLLRLEEQRVQGRRHLPRPLVYLRCLDGVFVPAVCFADWDAPVEDTLREWQSSHICTFSPAPVAADFRGFSPTPAPLNAVAGRNPLAPVAAAQAAAACKELPWSRAPSSIGWSYPAFASPRAGQQCVTMGDVKAAAYATLAWEQLAGAAEQRKAALADQLDAEATSHPTERSVAAQCAAVRVQLTAAREALTFSTLELESLRERVVQRQRCLLREEEALAAVRQYERRVTAPETAEAQQEQVRAEEVQRAHLRAQLARGRQQRVRELCLVYSVSLSSQYASHACANAADAKDHINNAALPILFGRAGAGTASHLVARTADAMHEEAVGLGHACHVLVVLSVLYNCTLPYPILLGSGQSLVLASPNVDAAQAFAAPYTQADARKYPLSCHKEAERPLMMAGALLLLRDCAVLAKAMGKPERRIAACADRLGALLDLLLYDVE
ncbi:hypothetical protein ABL78_0980 [Leptomonas seymouri]|uniref:Uncharacterized protein n=1 Tax=Leptomonas seymouri TaxID=5684 RepID=A0A0N1PG49_LEPSE|nr:hypothetical protein ABL78_0980 [Leptomonas seymouri]|eukprot:KPI89908.1 hypothetical protein ABL78_0980 [Leptomonas seymouri]